MTYIYFQSRNTWNYEVWNTTFQKEYYKAKIDLIPFLISLLFTK